MNRIGEAYAQGLYTLAAEENLTEQILQEMNLLEQTVAKEQEYLRLMSTPGISKEERCEILDQAFRGKVHIYVLNFMKILTENGYFRQLAQCCRAYREQYNDEHGILPVQAVSAVALTQTQLNKLQQKLQQMTGKTVCLENRVDPTVLGGVRLDYDGVRIDGTVKNRLDSVRKVLEQTVL